MKANPPRLRSRVLARLARTDVVTHKQSRSRKKNDSLPSSNNERALATDITFQIMSIANLISKNTGQKTLFGSGLDPNGWRVIRFLALYGSASAVDIIAAFGMDKTTVSRTIAGLHRAKLIGRVANHFDRRQTMLSLSSTGRRIHDRILPIDRALDASFENQLTVKESRTLRQILVKLRAHAMALVSKKNLS